METEGAESIIGYVVLLVIVLVFSVLSYSLGVWYVTQLGVNEMSSNYLTPFNDLNILSDLTLYEHNYGLQVDIEVQNLPEILKPLYGASARLFFEGSVRAGISLDGLTEDSFRYDRASRFVTLYTPPPAIQLCSIDESRTVILDISKGTFSAYSEVQLASEARQQALGKFAASSMEIDILGRTAQEATRVLERFGQNVLSLGGSSLRGFVVQVAEPETDQILPTSCVAN